MRTYKEIVKNYILIYNKLGSFPCIHSATLTGRTYTPLAV